MAYRTSRESVAYDYEQYEARFGRSPKPEEPQKQVRSNLRAVPTAQPRVFFHMKNFLTAMVVLLVAGVMIHSYMLVTEKTSEVAAKKSELSELEAIHTALLTKQEYNLSGDAIEEYATTQLGMVKLDNSQVEYVEMSNPDKVEVSGAGAGLTGAWDSLVKSFSAVLEYLR